MSAVVAVLGLGTMGSGMAHRLLAAGFSLKLFNRNPERYRSFEGSAAQLCKSPAEAVRGADIVISMVSDDTVSRAIWADALPAVSPGAAATVPPNVTSSMRPPNRQM